jgi:serine/threonine protein kinase
MTDVEQKRRPTVRSADGPPIEVGARIEKRFEIRRLIGTGSFGVVYEAFDTLRHRTVALKTLTQADAGSVARFKREFHSLAELRHPNLASLYELLVLGEEWGLSMDLVRGTDLLEHLTFAEIQSAFLDPGETSEPFDADARISLRRRPAKQGKLSAVYLQHVRETFRQLAEGIAFLHANGVVHRDVKPSNVMITPEGRVVLLDFGLAIDGRSDATLDDDLIVGTPGYMSPEQIAMLKPAPPSDWYSFGVMLYQALTGRRLFNGASAAELIDQQLRATPPPSCVVLPGLPQECDGNPALLEQILRHVAHDAAAEPLLADAVATRLLELSTSARRIFTMLLEADGPIGEEEVERHLELFESDEPLRVLTRARLIRLRRTGDLLELDLYHPKLRELSRNAGVLAG